MKKLSLLILSSLLMGNVLMAQRIERTLENNWRFTRNDSTVFSAIDYNDSAWEQVRVPHDWAIYGPFSFDNDKQNLAIAQDGQTHAMEHAGRTGGLPFVGTGWYRHNLTLPENLNGKRVLLTFDGAMSHAKVFVNGKEVIYWPYGYNSFYVDVTEDVKSGMSNSLAVRLENKHESSRWYPGAGLYRNVHLTILPEVHIAQWGNKVTTPIIKPNFARVEVETLVANLDKIKVSGAIDVVAEVIDPSGRVISQRRSPSYFTAKSLDTVYRARFEVRNPKLWDIDQPNLYQYRVSLYQEGQLLDQLSSTFGIRSIEIRQNAGFFLNGRKVKFKGVCLHHDLGPLGAAVNVAAMRRQIKIMQDMGANAIRTSHNMPAPEFVQLCDEMGIMLMAESFDSWSGAKVPNGYNLDFMEWHERDLVNLIHQYRNSPSIVMWSIGNEVIEQGHKDGVKMAYRLQAICHREDPTRPVTNGMDNPNGVMNNGMAAILDVPGFNYRPFKYKEALQRLPQGFILGSETASTVSSRGVYKFPVQRRAMATYEDHQASSYDVEHCSWSNLPEDDWMRHEDMENAIGEFIWTGFDYLGEPSPYYTNWPSHSSLFGAVDLAGIPKDRFYLYRSHWNKAKETLHILPHWTFPERVGQVTPIFVYTSYPEAELFINNKSYGRKKKDLSIKLDNTENNEAHQKFVRQRRYRLMWDNVKYEKGLVKVVAYDKDGKVAEVKQMMTADAPYRLELSVDRKIIVANGKDLAFIRVRLVDKWGNLIPRDERLVEFEVNGVGHFRAAASGNPASLDLFHKPYHHLFSGELTAIVESGYQTGEISFTARAKGVRSATIKIEVERAK